ncbi:MAG TPA: hypothetical protein PKC06_16480 [Saprospiraceae bacterium]|jgi:hypothetical protein|nr:hypothetical protein [Saprospiraceae bacterium]
MTEQEKINFKLDIILKELIEIRCDLYITNQMIDVILNNSEFENKIKQNRELLKLELHKRLNIGSDILGKM